MPDCQMGTHEPSAQRDTPVGTLGPGFIDVTANCGYHSGVLAFSAHVLTAIHCFVLCLTYADGYHDHGDAPERSQGGVRCCCTAIVEEHSVFGNWGRVR